MTDRDRRPRTIFVTGTDTGVGKTLLTALLLAHARQGHAGACALKPFCSGSRADAQLLHGLQGGGLALDDINPFFFPQPLAPAVAARERGRRGPSLGEVVGHIRSVSATLDRSACLFIEGSGGLLVPLGEGYTVLDLIVALRCETLLVSANRLGTINHTLLSVEALQRATRALPRALRRRSPAKVVLMDRGVRDSATAANPAALARLLAPVPLIGLPFLGRRASTVSAVVRHAKIIKKTLARILN